VNVDLPKRTEGTAWDVLVAGGGPAGAVAAIQAGRLGAKVLLVEKTGMLGGATTVAGVAFPGLFHASGRQVIAGIGWELVERCVRECGLTMPDFSAPGLRHSQYQVKVDGPVYSALCDEFAVNAGVELLLHAMPMAAARSESGWRVSLATKSGPQQVSAAVLLDCTGDANLAALAGAELRMPEERQPATLICGASGFDSAALDMDLLNSRFREAVGRGELAAADACWDTLSPSLRWVEHRGGSTNHIGSPDAQSSEGRTRLELEARRSLLRLYRFLRRQPGLQNLRIDWAASECGVRESVTVVGEETVTMQDYVSGREWSDAVCCSYYPIDLHTLSGNGLDLRMLPEGRVPTVPRGALIPKGIEGFLVAGRCVSSDRMANSALRVQASCMAMGQAAGVIASLAVQTGSSVREVPLGEVKNILRLHGAIVPGR
jgi:hypothetical protein